MPVWRPDHNLRMAPHLVHVTVVHGRYDTRILLKQCASLSDAGVGRVSLFVADGLGDESWRGVTIRDVGQPRFGRVGRAVAGSIRMWRAVRAAKPDLVHVHDPELLPLAGALRLAGIHVVFDMHENLPKEILTKTWVAGPARRVLSGIMRLGQRAATRRIPTVFAEKSYVQDFPATTNSVVVLNFPLVDSLLRVQAEKRSTFTVGYIGGVSAERGAPVLLDAVARVRAAGTRAECTLVGPVANEPELQTLIAQGTAEGWLMAPGRLKPEDGWHSMAQCHVGVAVLQPSENFVDSYPTKLFEYMALGLPVIVSNFPLWRDVVESAGCGIAVPPDDPQALADAIARLATNPPLRQEMGGRGRSAVQAEYRWESEFSKLRRFYERLLTA